MECFPPAGALLPRGDAGGPSCLTLAWSPPRRRPCAPCPHVPSGREATMSLPAGSCGSSADSNCQTLYAAGSAVSAWYLGVCVTPRVGVNGGGGREAWFGCPWHEGRPQRGRGQVWDRVVGITLGGPLGAPSVPWGVVFKPPPPILLAYSLRMDGQHRLVL